jgi:hypothetical protein
MKYFVFSSFISFMRAGATENAAATENKTEENL